MSKFWQMTFTLKIKLKKRKVNFINTIYNLFFWTISSLKKLLINFNFLKFKFVVMKSYWLQFYL